MNTLKFKTFSHLLVAAIGLAVLTTSCNPAAKYAKEAQKWEPNIKEFERLDQTEKYPDDAILFTGSSSITIWKSVNEDMAPYHAINRGFGGSKFSDLDCYIERIVNPHQFRGVVIFEANDITGSTTDKTPQEDVVLFKDIVKKIRKKAPDNPIFLIEITPTKLRWAVWPTIKEANRLLKQTCASLPHVYFIDTASSYLNEKGEPRTELAQADMLHQNHDGYVIWTKLIKDKLDQTFATTEKGR